MEIVGHGACKIHRPEGEGSNKGVAVFPGQLTNMGHYQSVALKLFYLVGAFIPLLFDLEQVLCNEIALFNGKAGIRIYDRLSCLRHQPDEHQCYELKYNEF